MTLYVMACFLGAAYLFGVGSTIGVLSRLVHNTYKGAQPSCFLRVATAGCFVFGLLLIIEGLMKLNI